MSKGYLYRMADAIKWGWDGIEGYRLSSINDFETASASIVKVTGSHGKSRDEKSTLIYYLIKGNGIFKVGDQKYHVMETDVVIIPPNTDFDFEGNMELLLVNTPAYNPKKN